MLNKILFACLIGLTILFISLPAAWNSPRLAAAGASFGLWPLLLAILWLLTLGYVAGRLVFNSQVSYWLARLGGDAQPGRCDTALGEASRKVFLATVLGFAVAGALGLVSIDMVAMTPQVRAKGASWYTGGQMAVWTTLRMPSRSGQPVLREIMDGNRKLAIAAIELLLLILFCRRAQAKMSAFQKG
jgi:hypothetical protein